MNTSFFKSISRVLVVLAMVVTGCIAQAQAAGEARFIPLGGLGGTSPTSIAYDVSSDGTVVVGEASGSGAAYGQAFRWTETGGMVSLGAVPDGFGSWASRVTPDGQAAIGTTGVAGTAASHAFRWQVTGSMVDLGTLPGFYKTWARGVSADGGIVVGQVEGDYPNSAQAFRWTEAGGIAGLGYLPGGAWNDSKAQAVSADGQVIVGVSRSARAAGYEAFRWTAATGMVGLGLLPGGASSNASHVSNDGAVVAGNASPYDLYQSRAFRWTAATGMVSLGVLPGGTQSVLADLSADGRVAVGHSGSEAYRWTEATGMVGLGRLSGDNGTAATLVSADGSVIVGYSYTATASEYFVWTGPTGIRRLRDILAADGLDVSAWRDLKVNAISDDGRTVVGEGYNPRGLREGWVVRLPNLAPLADAGGPYSGAKNTPIVFDGSRATDPEGAALIYRWEFGDGAIGSGSAPTHVYTAGGTYSVTLVVNDGTRDSVPATTTVTVINEVPVAMLSGPGSAYKLSPVTWSASGSVDGNGDALQYFWNFGDGTSVTTTVPEATHSYLSTGTYTATLVVNDGEADSEPVTQTITIQSQSPVANAGPDQTVLQRTTVTLNGGASIDPDGAIALARWRQLSGPAVSILGSNSLTASFVAPRVFSATQLVFELTVTDDDGISASDQVTVTVLRR